MKKRQAKKLLKRLTGSATPGRRVYINNELVRHQEVDARRYLKDRHFRRHATSLGWLREELSGLPRTEVDNERIAAWISEIAGRSPRHPRDGVHVFLPENQIEIGYEECLAVTAPPPPAHDLSRETDRSLAVDPDDDFARLRQERVSQRTRPKTLEEVLTEDLRKEFQKHLSQFVNEPMTPDLMAEMRASTTDFFRRQMARNDYSDDLGPMRRLIHERLAAEQAEQEREDNLNDLVRRFRELGPPEFVAFVPGPPDPGSTRRLVHEQLTRQERQENRHVLTPLNQEEGRATRLPRFLQEMGQQEESLRQALLTRRVPNIREMTHEDVLRQETLIGLSPTAEEIESLREEGGETSLERFDVDDGQNPVETQRSEQRRSSEDRDVEE